MDAQFKKGVLDLVVLSALKEEDRYGYEMMEDISRELEVTAGTLYLILKRQKDAGHLETYLQESSGGPARKYYHLTEHGRTVLGEKKRAWEAFVGKVAKLI